MDKFFFLDIFNQILKYGEKEIRIIFDSNGDIYQSNGTTAWVKINGNLPANLEDVSIAFYLNKIVLGIHGEGVYQRKENGGDWLAINNGLGFQFSQSSFEVLAVNDSIRKAYSQW